MVCHNQIGKGNADEVNWDTNYNKGHADPKCDDKIAIALFRPYVVEQFAFHFISI